MVLEEIENKAETIELLQIILKSLTDLQGKVLLMTGANYTVGEISRALNVDYTTVVHTRDSIANRLLKVVDENKINKLKDKINKVGKAKRKKLIEELNARLAVREAMKKLFVILTPPQSDKSIGNGITQPAYLFERLMNIGTGQKKSIVHGHAMYTNTSKCMLPEYFKEVFGDGKTHCTLCATCRRKKDNPRDKSEVLNDRQIEEN